MFLWYGSSNNRAHGEIRNQTLWPNVSHFLQWERGEPSERAIQPHWKHPEDMLNQEEAQMGETRIIIKGIQGFDEKISKEPHTSPGDAGKPGGWVWVHDLWLRNDSRRMDHTRHHGCWAYPGVPALSRSKLLSMAWRSRLNRTAGAIQ